MMKRCVKRNLQAIGLVSISMQNIFRIVLGTAFILSIPLVAMQFTDEVSWTLSDFVIMGALLLGTGFMYELVTRGVKSSAHRFIAASVLLLALLLIWADLAVGIFNIPGFSGS